MHQLAISRRPLTYAARVGVLAALYFVAAKLSLLLAIPPGYATAVWPPSGLAVAAMLLAGNRLWPGVWLGAAVANLTVNDSGVAAVLIGTGNALEAVAAAALIRRLIGVPERFESGEDVFKFVAVAAATSAVSATIGVGAIALAGPKGMTEFATNWWTWWQGDVTGIIVFAPVILFWTARPSRGLSASKKIEATLFALVLAAAGYIVFGSGMASLGFSPALLLLTFPLIIWAALRFDQLEVSAAITALSAIAVVYTIVGRGPFVSTSVNGSLLLLLAFVSIVAITGLVLSAVVGQRRRATQALHQARDELEVRVSLRTQELEQANQALRQDIVVRTKLEDELRRSEEKFRLLVGGIRDYAVFMLDPEGRIASWNAGAESIKGYKAEEIIGEHFSRFYPQESIDAKVPQMELEVAARVGRFEDEGWRLRKDGSRFWANVIITALRNEAGELVGFAKVTRDLTERRAAQIQALADMRRLTEADMANRAKSEFLMAMSHELRTPLNAIGGYAELLSLGLGGGVTDRQREYLGRIRKSQQHLMALINDILNFSRIEGGQITYEATEISVASVIDAVVPMIEPQAETKHLQITRQTSDDVVACADRGKFEQIIINLLSNSVKYTDVGGRIDISWSEVGGRAQIRVTDTGIGIPADKLTAIFEPFVQVGRSLARPTEGTGLGLAISRDLARGMGGDLTAESSVGEGAIFTLTLPGN